MDSPFGVNEAMKQNPRIFVHILLLALISGIQIWHLNVSISNKPINESSDANYYMRMTYHIYHHHVVSGAKSAIKPDPTARREPAFSFYMSSMMHFYPKFKSVDFSVLTKAEGALQMFRRSQIPVLVISSLCAWIFTYLLTRKFSFSYLSMFLVAFGNSLLIIANEIKREHFMAAVLLIAAIFLYLSIKHQKKKYFALLGLSLGVLVLSNAIFQYFAYILILYFFFLMKKGVFEKKKCLIFIGIFFAAYLIPVGSWQIRNYKHFKRFYICDRAGGVLAIRAEYNKMTADEWGGAFFFWTPDPLFQQKAVKEMQKGRWINLHRSNPKGYYKTAKSIKNFKAKEDVSLNPAQQDKTIQKRALTEIIKHPVKHIATTLPFAWRGMFVEYGYLVNVPFSIIVRSIVLVSLLYFAALFFLFVHSYQKQNWPLFSVTLICIYLFGMNAFFSHSLPRYNQPLIPLLAVLFMTAINQIFYQKAAKEKTSKPKE